MDALSLRRLEYFLVVAEELSITRAARRLLIAQPPLSQQIHKLERELGCTLFVRTARGLRLTPAGVALVQGASSLLGEADRVGARVRAVATGETGFLTVGCVPVACSSIAASLVRRFHQVHPHVQVHIQEFDTASLYNALSTRGVDIGIVRTGVDAPGLDTEVLIDERPLIALPDEHALAGYGALSLADFAAEDFVMYRRKLGIHHFDEFVAACRTVGGFSPHIVSECDTVNAQLAMIGAGLGVGLVTELSGGLETRGVVYRELGDLTMRLPLVLAWPGQHDDPVRSRFVDVAAQWRDDFRSAAG